MPEHALEAAALAYLEAWAPHIEHAADAAETLEALRAAGIRIAMLSNTHWPRDFHERFLARDGLAELIDARVYTSELAYMKPHPSAFAAALGAVGVRDPSRAVFVGDRPWDDIFGARRAAPACAPRRLAHRAAHERARAGLRGGAGHRDRAALGAAHAPSAHIALSWAARKAGSTASRWCNSHVGC